MRRRLQRGVQRSVDGARAAGGAMMRRGQRNGAGGSGHHWHAHVAGHKVGRDDQHFLPRRAQHTQQAGHGRAGLAGCGQAFVKSRLRFLGRVGKHRGAGVHKRQAAGGQLRIDGGLAQRVGEVGGRGRCGVVHGKVQAGQGGGGIAWQAHLGGLLTGAAVAAAIAYSGRNRGPLEPPTAPCTGSRWAASCWCWL